MPRRQSIASSHTLLVKDPPTGDEWVHELKFDGYRMLCRIDRGKVTFWSRNEKEWTAKFPNVVESVKSLPLTTAILDGEIVMVDAQGHSSFQKLQRAMSKSATSAFVYEVFDLIYLGGYSLNKGKVLGRRQDKTKETLMIVTPATYILAGSFIQLDFADEVRPTGEILGGILDISQVSPVFPPHLHCGPRT